MEWRMSSRPSSLLAVTMATESPSETTASKSTGVSLTMPASAARASPAPMGGGHVGDGGALFQLLDGSVGQYDVHGTPFLAPGAHRAPARFPPGR